MLQNAVKLHALVKLARQLHNSFTYQVRKSVAQLLTKLVI